MAEAKAEDDNVIRSRDKSDTFHKTFSTNIPKDCPVSPSVFQLLHRATWAINVEEGRK